MLLKGTAGCDPEGLLSTSLPEGDPKQCKGAGLRPGLSLPGEGMKENKPRTADVPYIT